MYVGYLVLIGQILFDCFVYVGFEGFGWGLVQFVGDFGGVDGVVMVMVGMICYEYGLIKIFVVGFG